MINLVRPSGKVPVLSLLHRLARACCLSDTSHSLLAHQFRLAISSYCALEACLAVNSKAAHLLLSSKYLPVGRLALYMVHVTAACG